ncbi:hypothetical protein SAMN06297144_1756 [Sphingomonas guangdongensis]|uniref:Uncharacterized protein n=1 Tax=Sphingomonas guangdongensis TaxID=1141890 RepID=A0A285QZ65_9SPHN|nr:hypothetical protein [Sphingomonas guangdongensis]SOB86649.1 hypothetical protein SAMN06297144_1756 [Sphingomonas guangdongensis]
MVLALALLAIIPQQAAPAPEPAREESKVCRRIQITGSRTGGARECRTAAEWAKLDADNAGKANREIRGLQGPN